MGFVPNFLENVLKPVLEEMGAYKIVSQHWKAVKATLEERYGKLSAREEQIARTACERLIEHIV